MNFFCVVQRGDGQQSLRCRLGTGRGSEGPLGRAVRGQRSSAGDFPLASKTADMPSGTLAIRGVSALDPTLPGPDFCGS